MKKTDCLCYEYICGACTKSIFYVEGLTEPCQLIHKDDVVNEYKKDINKIHDFEWAVLKVYNKIIDDIDKKIKCGFYNFNELDEKRNIAIRKNEEKISNLLEENKINQIKHYLELQGKLLNLEMKRKNKFYVCPICSAIYDIDGKCTHPFHEHYKLIRKKRRYLSKKLEGVKLNNPSYLL
ncbi:hypothetical protein TCON_2479 [Astathelohania contejeani]|uniref:C2H2-type domain-containing protein n=1 Tax=Astathelohania contejeani TaxID=164912 RepID=A0ABQ7HVW1_9MICR|nr:hypothetical protein TCON_2479 [Thelohania contejeani]